MRYIDTSALVPLFVPERASGAMEAWFAAVDPATLQISQWTAVEFVSAIGAKVRAQLISKEKGAAVIHRFTLLAQTSLPPLMPDEQDYRDAIGAMGRFELGLRAGDALHVAIAKNAGSAAFVTLDRVLAHAADILSLKVEMPA